MIYKAPNPLDSQMLKGADIKHMIPSQKEQKNITILTCIICIKKQPLISKNKMHIQEGSEEGKQKMFMMQNISAKTYYVSTVSVKYTMKVQFGKRMVSNARKEIAQLDGKEFYRQDARWGMRGIDKRSLTEQKIHGGSGLICPRNAQKSPRKLEKSPCKFAQSSMQIFFQSVIFMQASLKNKYYFFSLNWMIRSLKMYKTTFSQDADFGYEYSLKMTSIR